MASKKEKSGEKNSGIDYVKLIASIVICQAVGIAGSLFTVTGEGSWYSSLVQPSFNPPNWVFGPVWTALYLLMGISLYIIWKGGLSNGREKRAVLFFGVQLGLNFLWSLLFFGIQSPIAALFGIIFLWIAIFLTIACFYRIQRTAAYLMIPYLLWVTFAAALNLGYVLLN